MYSTALLAAKYFHYLLTAQNGKGHGIHSPFVFHFIKEILNDQNNYEEYEKIERLRAELLNNNEMLEIEDLGAGSRITGNTKRTVASIAKNSVKPKKYAQLLFRICRMFKPATVVELGTSLGITTGYLATGNNSGKVYSIEGSSAVADLAARNLTKLGIENIEVIHGDFERKLPGLLQRIGAVDLAFIDGNHRQVPTLKYFEELLSKRTNHSIFIFDDIHWSREMENAWQSIRAHSSVTCTIDLFFIGLVFFRTEFKQTQHFRIRF